MNNARFTPGQEQRQRPPSVQIAVRRSLLKAPVFENDDEKTRVGRTLHTVLLVLIGATALAYFSLLVSAAPVRVIAITGLLLAELTSYVMLQRGLVRQSAILLCTFTWVILVTALFFTGGVDGSSNPVLTAVVLSAGLLLGGAAGLVFAALSTAAGLVMLIAELNGVLPTSLIEANPGSYWLFVSLTFFASAGLIYITTSSLKEAIGRARANEAAQLAANRELQKIRASLEEQVSERTQLLEMRSRYLQAAIEVSRASASILDIDQLIQQIVDLIQEQFGLYYVGLFLVDTEGEWAVHKAGTGLAGRTLLRRGHRIRIGSGMIGWCIANALPRVAASATEDAQRLVTAELPETRSEAAIPLRSRGKILGAISVQSEKPNAFGEMEMISFQAMADQVALAIDNARLFSEAQSAVQEVQRAYGVASRLAWKEMLQTASRIAYRYEEGNVASISESAGSPQEGEQAIAAVRVPIKVRDQVVGMLSVRRPADSTSPLPADVNDLLQGLGEQLGIALDSARLYQDSQRLALREQLTSELTSRIRATLDIDAVLKTAVQEIQQTLGAPEVVIALRPQAWIGSSLIEQSLTVENTVDAGRPGPAGKETAHSKTTETSLNFTGEVPGDGQ